MEQAGPRRSPPGGGYQRGDEKRTRIVEAALRAFGEHGFQKASTRQIARDAGVNPPALQYYFDGKDGLHLACAEYIAERITRELEPSYEVARQVGPGDPDRAIEALCGILDALADFLFGSRQIEGWSKFFAKGQGEENTPAHSYLKQRVAAGIHANCLRLVSLASGDPPDDVRTKLRALSITGQLTIFHLGRDNALASLGWPDFRGERLDMLKRMVRSHTRAILSPGTKAA